jgi:DNA-cytosine methyltransferase
MEKITDFKILDLFCGAGGFSFGMHQNSHFKTLVALDFNEEAADTFKRNMPEAEVVTGDITDAETKNLIIEKSKAVGVNMIIGGPPCQGFSMKGKKLGLEDERNYLFREYLKLVEELEPEVFVIENVKSLLSTAGGYFREQILEYIDKLGYSVNYGILNAKDFGVPQSRERAIFICSKNKNISLPAGTDEGVTIRDAISDLAYLNSAQGTFESEYQMKASSDYQRKMRAKSDKLYNHQATAHSKVALEKLAMIPAERGKEYLPDELKGKQKFNTTWGRLVWDGVSPTIDTRFDAPSNGTNSHPELNRSITPREAARIQSFSDDFIFYGGKRSVGRQIGNAVPPLLAKGIADKIWEMYEDGKNDI